MAWQVARLLAAKTWRAALFGHDDQHGRGVTEPVSQLEALHPDYKAPMWFGICRREPRLTNSRAPEQFGRLQRRL